MPMNKIGFLLVNALAFALVGCSSSSPSEPITGPVGGSTDTGSSGSTGTSPIIGENPGLVREPVIAVLTTIDLPNLGGHVVYAGPDEEAFEGYSYVNIDFACDGTGTYELHPAAFEPFASNPIYSGTLVWTLSDGGQGVNVDIPPDAELGADSITVKPTSAGTLIVGQSTLQSKVVDNILQYEDCS